MPRKEQGWITFQSSEEERRILEKYCHLNQRTKTEILRQLVRSLSESPPAADNPVPIPGEDGPLKSMKLSARNILGGKITRLVMGPVDTEVFIEIAPGIEIISVISTASAENLGLRVKKTVYAVIKSTSFILGDETMAID